MIIPSDTLPTYPWLICERSGRWQTATFRFAEELSPPGLVASIEVVEAAQLAQQLATRDKLTRLGTAKQPSLCLCEVDAENFAKVFDQILLAKQEARARATSPNGLRSVLYLIADAGISPAAQHALLEVGVTTLLRHPEELPGLLGLIGRFFQHRAV